MTELGQLFSQEELIQRSVREISQGVIDLSDFVITKSPIELAEAEVVGKRLRVSCDKISEQVHSARKILGALFTSAEKVKFKNGERELHDMEDELSLIHGDLEAIGQIAEKFATAKDRKAAFKNLSRHYSALIENITSLMVDEHNLRDLL